MQTVQEALEEVAAEAQRIVDAADPKKFYNLRDVLWRLKQARTFPVPRDRKVVVR